MRTISLKKDLNFRLAVLANRFKKEKDGVAAVEFALIAPLLILLFFGTLEISTAVAINRKVSRISSTVGDLITQSQTLTGNDIVDIMKSASYVMRPYDHTVGIVISGIEIESGNAKVDWSCAQHGTADVPASLYDVPAKIKIDGTYLVAAKVTLSHTPMVAMMTLSDSKLETDRTAIDMEEQIFLRPRIGSSTEIQDAGGMCSS